MSVNLRKGGQIMINNQNAFNEKCGLIREYDREHEMDAVLPVLVTPRGFLVDRVK